MEQAVTANAGSVSEGKICPIHSPQQNCPSGIRVLPSDTWHKGLVNLHPKAFSKAEKALRSCSCCAIANWPFTVDC